MDASMATAWFASRNRLARDTIEPLLYRAPFREGAHIEPPSTWRGHPTWATITAVIGGSATKSTFFCLTCLGAVALGSGCYSPSFQEGVLCGDEGECPSGQSCVSGECRTASMLPDAGEVVCPNPTALMFEPTNFDICDIPADPPALELTTSTPVDTDAGTIGGQPAGIVLEQTDGPEILLVATRSFSLNDQDFLDVTGSRPLVILSLSDITIDGVVLASGNLEDNGSGVLASACSGGVGVGTAGVVDGAAFTGGGGGGAEYAGGLGAGLPGGVVVDGGTANGGVSPLRGGCPGGAGGGERGGYGGGGGGGIQFVAAGSVNLGAGAIINVAGGGGRGGGLSAMGVVANDGGGGGGSGGTILIEAGLGITAATGSIITAAGGGGGGGALGTLPGTDGTNGGSAGPGPGGVGATDMTNAGGAGGTGGGLDPNFIGADGLPGMVMAASGGGGGGGGGTGRVVLRSPSTTFDGTSFPTISTQDL